MKKAAVLIDDWKLPIFKKVLDEAGYKYKKLPGLSPDTIYLAVIILTIDELKAITGRTRNTAIIRQLDKMGIPCKKGADGFPIVSRLAFERSYGFEYTAGSANEEIGINLDFLEG